MNPKITREDISALIPNIKQTLARYAPLPPTGLLAGQAVASVLYDRLQCTFSGPINDVDVFMTLDDYYDLKSPLLSTITQAQLDEAKNQSGQCHPNDDTRSELAKRRDTYSVRKTPTIQPYGQSELAMIAGSHQAMNTVFKGLYRIDRAFKNDKLNIVLVSAPSGSVEHYAEHIYQNIIDSFDLNCTAVGIDLETDELYVTQAFLEFINSGVLSIQSAHTPLQTMLRVAKKAKFDLINVQCDLQKEIDCLTSAAVIALRYVAKDTMRMYDKKDVPVRNYYRAAMLRTPFIFGLKNKELFDQVAEYLPDFECVEQLSLDGQAMLYTLKTNRRVMTQAMRRGRQLLALQKLQIAHTSIKCQFVDLYHSVQPENTRNAKYAVMQKYLKPLASHHLETKLEEEGEAFMVNQYLFSTLAKRADADSVEAWQRAGQSLKNCPCVLAELSELPMHQQSQAIAYVEQTIAQGRWDLVAEIARDGFYRHLDFDVTNINKLESVFSTEANHPATFLRSQWQTGRFTLKEIRSANDFHATAIKQNAYHQMYRYSPDYYKLFSIITPDGEQTELLLSTKALYNPKRRIFFKHSHFGMSYTKPSVAHQRIAKAIVALYAIIYTIKHPIQVLIKSPIAKIKYWWNDKKQPRFIAFCDDVPFP